MSNHVHWALQLLRRTTADFIHPLHTGFAEWLNRVDDALGPVFAQRHTSIAFGEEDYAKLIAYIHNNPVRAGLVKEAAESPWSSHRAWIGDVPAPAWLEVERGLSLCGFDSSAAGRVAFDAWVRAEAANPVDPRLAGGDPEQVRGEIRRIVGRAVEITAPELLGGELVHDARAPEGATLRPAWDGSPMDLLEIISTATDVPVAHILSPSRRRDVVAARRLAALVWFEHLGRALTEVAAALGISLPAASQLLRRDRGRVERHEAQARLIAEMCWGKNE
jgi:hypothetical protein